MSFRFRPRRRAALSAAALVAALVAPGCVPEAREPESYCSPYRGAAPVTIRGAAPAASGTDVVALLGPPDRRNGTGFGRESLQWQRFTDLVVTLDTGTGRVTEVVGNELTAEGERILWSGMSEADVRAVLGKPARSVGRYRPSGSGVISLGGRRYADVLTYLRDGRLVEVTLNEGALAFIRMTTAP